MKWPLVILVCLTLNGLICSAQTSDSLAVSDTVRLTDSLSINQVTADTSRTTLGEPAVMIPAPVSDSADSSATESLEAMTVQGRVAHAKTNKGIRATIHYSSIPTGSISGKFYDSTFSFQIFGTAKYQVTAEARGYNPRTIIVDPKDTKGNQRLQRDIRLMPSGETIRLEHLIFPQGKSTIAPESFQELDEIAMMMKENERIVIQLEGHTDNVGNAKANLKLSQQRVDAVKKYLVKSGISKNRVKVKSFGGAKPLRNEMTPEARAMNRRVEMRILED